MDFRPTPEQDLLRRSVREFAEAEIGPHVREWDRDQHFPVELVPKLAALGLMGIQIPEARGGAGLSAIDYCICLEEIARVDPAVALSVAAHNGLCAAHLALVGSAHQQQTYLVPLARGEKIGAWALTESTSGSDAANMRTAATDTGDGWVLNGSKAFTTHGRVGDILVVMAVTDRTAGPRGISAFIVERGTPGLLPGKKEDKIGMRASDTSEVRLDNCRVSAEQLLGEQGHGFTDAMRVLDSGRIGIAALAVGLAQGAHEAAVRYARERTAFGKPIATFQAIQWKIADNATRIEAARLLTYRAAYLEDHGRPTTLESSMAKLYSSEMAVRAAEDCVQIHGGYGLVKDYPAEKFFRDVKLTTIGEGTSEIQRLVIARQLLSR
ncbi:MAG: acyl-CoA dehydrogenase [Acidobacteria bacterium RIFCSPLOWO2_02_FULL_64_15]|nr:MAG: acyl-CoA dehydrogenase [Acidobacteria bacterium RIFCSPLOWO2_02_FULL_64_15]